MYHHSVPSQITPPVVTPSCTFNVSPVSKNNNNNNNKNDIQTESCGQLSDLDFITYYHPVECIQQLRRHVETIDLVLCTNDGGIEPVHSYYLAWKAPKFWAQIQQLINHKYTTIERTIMNENEDDDKYYGISKQYGAMWHTLLTNEGIKRSVPAIIIPTVDRRMLSIVVNSMYAGAVQLDYTLAWQLLALARSFNLDFLTIACFEYLQRSLCSLNCVHLLQVALQFDQLELASSAYRFVVQHFVELVRNHGAVFVDLTVKQFTSILADNQLNVGNEIFVWRALMRWMSDRSNDKVAHFWHLFPLVRFNFISTSTLRLEVAQTYCDLDRSMEYALSKCLQIKSLSRINLFNPRLPRQIALIYGGYEHGLPSCTLKTFDIRAGMWFTTPLPDGVPRVYHQSVLISGDQLYIIGGSDGIKVLSSVHCFDLTTAKFITRKSMIEPRAFHCAVRYRNYLVVMGGNNGKERLRSVELYDPARNTWRYMAPMNSARSDAASTVVHDKIYIAGGVEAFGLSSVEVYSFQSRSWLVISFMHFPRRSFALLHYADSLFAVGGCADLQEYTCLKSVERMNLRTNQWNFVPSLCEPKASFSGFVLEDKMFIVGGYDGFSSHRSMECYNLHTNRWEPVPYRLPHRLSATTAMVAIDLWPALHYTYYGQCLLDRRYVKTTIGVGVGSRSLSQRSPRAIAQWLAGKSVRNIKRQFLFKCL